MSYIDYVWPTIYFLQSVKTNNFTVYAQCLCLMPNRFFSSGGYNYARYLTFSSLFIANIEHSHPSAEDLLKRYAVSVARSFIWGNGYAIDKTIEETFMKHATSNGRRSSTGAVCKQTTVPIRDGQSQVQNEPNSFRLHFVEKDEENKMTATSRCSPLWNCDQREICLEGHCSYKVLQQPFELPKRWYIVLSIIQDSGFKRIYEGHLHCWDCW